MSDRCSVISDQGASSAPSAPLCARVRSAKLLPDESNRDAILMNIQHAIEWCLENGEWTMDGGPRTMDEVG